VRAMQQIIAASVPGQCVGLYCAKLLDLGTSDNALADWTKSARARTWRTERGAMVRIGTGLRRVPPPLPHRQRLHPHARRDLRLRDGRSAGG